MVSFTGKEPLLLNVWTKEPTGRNGEVNIFELPGLELQSFGRPVRSQSPYRLRYRDSSVKVFLAIVRKLFIYILLQGTVV
jgi:hypothetical protein